MISSTSLTPQISLVSDLIDSTNMGWNLDLIRSEFFIFEAKIIEGMPLSNWFPDEKQIWGVTSSGFFIVRNIDGFIA